MPTADPRATRSRSTSAARRPAHGCRSFCRRCGSSSFCEPTLHPDRIDIALGAMREAIDREPQLHAFFDSRAPWVAVADGLPRLGGKTGLEPLPDEAKPGEEKPK